MVLSNFSHREIDVWEGRGEKGKGEEERRGDLSSSCWGNGDPHIASQNWSKITQAQAVIPKVQEAGVGQQI